MSDDLLDDEHAPDLPGQTMVAAARDIHRAIHGIARALGLRRLQQLVAWLSRRLLNGTTGD
ncbi:hypothetical protein [Cellulosimicrobium funkei]|uniref:hypothetical protein n=1 Tax=Cellulosimicrobium funkei TaxID=264251 RepID=UPI003430D457